MAYFKRGEIFKHQDDFDAARFEFERAIEADPRFAYPLIMLAHLSMDYETNEESKQYIDRAIDLRPDIVEARLLRASILTQRGNDDLAMEDLRFVVETGEGWEVGNAYLELGYLEIRRGSPEAGLEYFAEAIDRTPEDTAPYVETAKVLASLGEREEAVVTLETAIEGSWDPGWATVELARLYLEFGEPEEALNHMVRLLGDEPERIEAFGVRGLAFVSLGEYESAIADFERYLEDHSWDSWSRGEYARALLRSGSLDEAEAHFGEAIDHWWDNVHARLGRAEIAEARGATEIASEDLHLAVEMASYDIYVVIRAALFAERTGDSDWLQEMMAKLDAFDPEQVETDSLDRLDEYLTANPDIRELAEEIIGELPAETRRRLTDR